jgi:hypothetical protein
MPPGIAQCFMPAARALCIVDETAMPPGCNADVLAQLPKRTKLAEKMFKNIPLFSDLHDNDLEFLSRRAGSPQLEQQVEADAFLECVHDGQAADNHAKQAGEDAQQQGLPLSGCVVPGVVSE